jgi:hypothetical protein
MTALPERIAVMSMVAEAVEAGARRDKRARRFRSANARCNGGNAM